MCDRQRIRYKSVFLALTCASELPGSSTEINGILKHLLCIEKELTEVIVRLHELWS
jgi:hypothetical protein